VKADAGRASQIGPQNPDDLSHLPGGGLCFHKRAQTYRQAEDSTTARPIIAGATGAPITRCPVEVPISGLNQPRVGAIAVRAIGLGAKAVKRR
jgi:hypothetical protein